MKKVIVLLLLYLSSLFSFQVLAQQSAPPEKSMKAATEKRAASATENENVTTPGPEGGSCSATSDDRNKTCSINCKRGQAAICSSTKTTASCRCG